MITLENITHTHTHKVNDRDRSQLLAYTYAFIGTPERPQIPPSLYQSDSHTYGSITCCHYTASICISYYVRKMRFLGCNWQMYFNQPDRFIPWRVIYEEYLQSLLHFE